MKKLLLAAICIFGLLPVDAQNLTDGDILFTYIFSDADKNIGFIALKNIAPKEVIYFTDNAFLANSAFASNEGTIKWTCPDTGVTKGTQIHLLESSSQYSASVGQVVKSGSFTLSTSGDQLLAYQVSPTDTIFLAAINWGAKASWISSGDPTTAQSYLPKGLKSHLDFGVHRDNGVFTCPNKAVTTVELKMLLLSVDKWNLNDDRVIDFCPKIEINDTITSLSEDNSDNTVWIYPNPIQNKTIYFSKEAHNIKVLSLDGKVLFQNSVANTCDLSGLKQGTYLLITDEIKQKIVLE